MTDWTIATPRAVKDELDRRGIAYDPAKEKHELLTLLNVRVDDGAVAEPDQVVSTSAESLDATIQRLSALSLLAYDQVRKEAAKRFGIRPATLDAAVRDARKGSDTSDDLPFPVVVPWTDPVDPAELLDEIVNTIHRFIICDTSTAVAAALWIAATWFVEVVQVAPLAVITAPELRCGKTQLLSLMGKMVRRSLQASGISPAALYRAIEVWAMTMMVDECDALLKDNEELRGVLNSGHTRDSAYIIRTVGDDHMPTKFSTWGFKALSGIGHVASTLMDRSVILELRRKLPHEQVEKIRHAEPGLFETLSRKLARFAEDHAHDVQVARPPLPDVLNDRAQDNWEPLLAIAQIAGDTWLKKAIDAALKISGSEDAPSVGTELLMDIQDVFTNQKIDRIGLVELLRALCGDDEKPWSTYNRGLQMKPRQLSAKLKSYGISSKPIRIGNGVIKGYTVDQFREAFLRYAATPPQSVTKLQTNDSNNLDADSFGYSKVTNLQSGYKVTPTEADDVTEEKLRNRSVTEQKPPKSLISKDCNHVTEQQGEIPNFDF